MITPKEFYNYTINEFAKEKLEKYKSAADAWSKQSTVFKARNKILVFIAASHVFGYNPFIRFLIKAFKKSNPQFVLVERSKNLKREQLVFWLSQKERTRTEVDQTIHLANKNHVGFAGMDVEQKMMFEPFLKLKDGIKVGILDWIIKYYHSDKYSDIEKILNSEDRYALAKATLIRDFIRPGGNFEYFKNEFVRLRESKYKQSNFGEMIDSIVTEMSRKYISKQPFLELFEKEKNLNAPYGPWPDSTKYKINKINAYWDSYRNICMINECIAKMKKFDRVFAVAGSGHIVVLRKPLAREIEKYFGSVEVLKYNEFELPGKGKMTENDAEIIGHKIKHDIRKRLWN